MLCLLFPKNFTIYFSFIEALFYFSYVELDIDNSCKFQSATGREIFSEILFWIKTYDIKRGGAIDRVEMSDFLVQNGSICNQNSNCNL